MKIFLIDDDPIFLFIGRKIIEFNEKASDVQEFDNVRESLDYLTQNVANLELLPDVIFLDLNLPLVDGWAFLEEYKPLIPKIDKKIHLFVLSSSISPHDIARAKSLPFVSDFIMKPLTKEGLQHILGKL